MSRLRHSLPSHSLLFNFIIRFCRCLYPLTGRLMLRRRKSKVSEKIRFNRLVSLDDTGRVRMLGKDQMFYELIKK